MLPLRRPSTGRPCSPVLLTALALVLPATLGAGGHSPGPDPDPGASHGDEVWGADGHRMAARAAVDALPAAMPDFFVGARARLAWLNPEPDRWRDRERRAMDEAWRYDHYIDLENIPEGSDARDAPHRYRFLQILWEDGVERPERDVGLLPWRIIELQQRLTSLWGRWSETSSAEVRRFIEARIVEDAGLLGHYVTDGSQPHHTTIHFNGWNASSGRSEPNPEGFTEDRDFHGRFETAFVSAHVREGSVRAAVPRSPRDLGDDAAVGEAVWTFIGETHGEVAPLYRLEKRVGFDPGRAPAPEARAFAEARIAAGAAMLRDLWWTAYVQGRAADRP